MFKIKDFRLSKGKSALLFPEYNLRYNIAGMFYCTDLIIDLLKLVQDKFDCNLPIRYLYGSPPIKWNGGRLLMHSDFFTINRIEQEIKKIIYNGIIPLFTFSNPLISKKDLDDSLCNNILNMIAEYNCQIIVTNKHLEEYVRKKISLIENSQICYFCCTLQNA